MKKNIGNNLPQHMFAVNARNKTGLWVGRPKTLRSSQTQAEAFTLMKKKRTYGKQRSHRAMVHFGKISTKENEQHLWQTK